MNLETLYLNLSENELYKLQIDPFVDYDFFDHLAVIVQKSKLKYLSLILEDNNLSGNKEYLKFLTYGIGKIKDTKIELFHLFIENNNLGSNSYDLEVLSDGI